MKSLVITPKDKSEFKLINDLLSKLGISVSALTPEEMEDLGLSKLMKGVDRSKTVSKSSILKKLRK
ncbi:MAG TPA: hypothetical protein VK826_17650 [Bacteroidia bacterium]|nr:hypothetical protein [Bacteroidia bacterium]